MVRAEWAMKSELNRREQKNDVIKARHALAVKLHAKRMIARMNREVLDPEKVMFDPETRQWRLLTDEEKLVNQMAKAELAKKETIPASDA